MGIFGNDYQQAIIDVARQAAGFDNGWFPSGWLIILLQSLSREDSSRLRHRFYLEFGKAAMMCRLEEAAKMIELFDAEAQGKA